MKHHLKSLLPIIIFLPVILVSCKKETQGPIPEETQPTAMEGDPLPETGLVENNMVMYWNEKAATVLNIHTNPGSDSRSFAIIQIAVHDALNNITPKYERYALNKRDQFADPDAAVASAAYWAIKGLNLQGAFPVDQWYTESLATIPNGTNKTKGLALGKKSADAILANRSNDGLSQVIFVSPIPLNGVNPGEYRSTLPFSNPLLNLPQLKLLANWGQVVRPFVTQNNYQFRPPGPYPVNSAEYTTDYNEVKSKGAMVGSTRTEEESLLNQFWLDNRIHIVWNDFTRKVILTRNMDPWNTARIFALIHTGMADGVSAMFESIYHFYHWRPETAIRIADDGNPNTVSDPEWLPSSGLLTPLPHPVMTVYSPRVPEYPSTFGICARITARMLKSLFGSDEISVDLTSATLPGVTLHYTSISNVAKDYSISKVLAGWTFRKAAEDGEEMGDQIGHYVYTHHFREQ